MTPREAQPEPRRHDVRPLWPLLQFAAGMIVTAFVASTTASYSVGQQIATLQTQVANQAEQLRAVRISLDAAVGRDTAQTAQIAAQDAHYLDIRDRLASIERILTGDRYAHRERTAAPP